MTNKDILKAFSGLDADTVIACAPGKAPQRKNRLVLRVVAIAACLALLVSAVVVSTLLLNREDENQPDVPSDVTEQGDGRVKYVMYVDHSASSAPFNSIENDSYTVEIRDQKDISFSLSNRNQVDRIKGTEDALSINLLGKNWTLNYSKTFSVGLDKSDRFAHLGIYTEYRTDGKTVDLNSVTNEIIYLSDLKAEVDVDGDFSAKDAILVADKILASLYGDKALEYYEEPISVASSAGEKVIYIMYQKSAYGYSTAENILIGFNRKGELLSINALNSSRPSSVESVLT